MVSLVWITPDAETQIIYCARVSNPKGQAEAHNNERLLAYLIKNKHWSPFEMASACIEIVTTRDIAHQILRHRSFSFQEFSQRYATTSELPEPTIREVRLQDTKNRQNSIEVQADNNDLVGWWEFAQKNAYQVCEDIYKMALERGVAKEVARAVLPEGMTPTRIYMTGTIRSWIHYCDIRTDKSTQKEHRLIAVDINNLLSEHLPHVFRTISD